MQGSKDIERTARTRTKNPERIEKALARKAAVKAREVVGRHTMPQRRAYSRVREMLA